MKQELIRVQNMCQRSKAIAYEISKAHKHMNKIKFDLNDVQCSLKSLYKDSKHLYEDIRRVYMFAKKGWTLMNQ